MQRLIRRLGILVLGCMSCGPTTPAPADSETGTTGPGTADDPTPTTGSPTDPASDLPPASCDDLGTCGALLDVLIIIDNSETMAEEQAKLAAAVPEMLAAIRGSIDADGDPRDLDVHLMITTTDNGHPLCAGTSAPDYVPAKGAPIASACVDRLARFETPGLSVPEACTAHCSPGTAAAPTDPVLAFGPDGDNVLALTDIGDPVTDALACMIPQGIDGCGMEETLVDRGVLDLVYRDWSSGDLAPGDPQSAAQHQFDLGVGPGCRHATDGFAAPPSRIRRVCASLDRIDEPGTPHDEARVRCTIQSVCAEDYGTILGTWFAGMLAPAPTSL